MTVWMIGGLGAMLGVASLLLAWAQNRGGATAGWSLPFGRLEARGGTGRSSASVFLALLSIAAFAMLAVRAEGPTPMPTATATAARNVVENTAKADIDVARVSAYLERVGRQPAPKPQSTAPSREDSGLPDVDTMIARLEQRLETSPGDVDGWRTLGWSYRNTDRLGEAVEAYERASDLAPERTDIAEALAEARSAANATEKTDAAQLTK